MSSVTFLSSAFASKTNARCRIYESYLPDNEPGFGDHGCYDAMVDDDAMLNPTILSECKPTENLNDVDATTKGVMVCVALVGFEGF